MKKLLLATTAFVGVAAFAQAASAQMTVTLGGSVSFNAGVFADTSTDVNQRSFDFQTDSELVVRADGKADNGLTYGAYVELEVDQDAGIGATDNPPSDEVNIYVAGGWGRIELGDQDGASDVLTIFAPANYGTGGLDGEYGDWIGFLPLGANGLYKPADSGDSTKITYYTPTFAGFQAGISYAPQTGTTNEGQNVNRNEFGGTFEDFVEIAARYTGEFGGFSVGVSGTYNFATAQPAAAGVQAVEDLQAWAVGASVGYAGFTVAGGYVNEGESGLTRGTVDNDDAWSWNIGAEYATGPFLVGVQYQYGEAEGAQSLAVPSGNTEFDAISVGANYTVAPGLTAYVDAVWYDIENGDLAPGAAGRDVDGQVVIVGTRVSF
jgi:predicted porin